MFQLVRYHRLFGAILLLPLLTWSLSGFFFFVKPGYREAYEMLAPKTYPLGEEAWPPHNPSWLEVRQVRTVLGRHLLVKTPEGSLHLHGDSALPWQANEADVRALLTDAIADSPRYGSLVSLNGFEGQTSTGVRLDLDWERLSMGQYGKDTGLIDLVYKIHYLQWTGQKQLDQVVGTLGLALLLCLSLTGFWLLLRRPPIRAGQADQDDV